MNYLRKLEKIDFSSMSVTFDKERGTCLGPKKEFLACFCCDILKPERKLFEITDDQQYSLTPLYYFADLIIKDAEEKIKKIQSESSACKAYSSESKDLQNGASLSGQSVAVADGALSSENGAETGCTSSADDTSSVDGTSSADTSSVDGTSSGPSSSCENEATTRGTSLTGGTSSVDTASVDDTSSGQSVTAADGASSCENEAATSDTSSASGTSSVESTSVDDTSSGLSATAADGASSNENVVTTGGTSSVDGTLSVDNTATGGASSSENEAVTDGTSSADNTYSVDGTLLAENASTSGQNCDASSSGQSVAAADGASSSENVAATGGTSSADDTSSVGRSSSCQSIVAVDGASSGQSLVPTDDTSASLGQNTDETGDTSDLSNLSNWSGISIVVELMESQPDHVENNDQQPNNQQPTNLQKLKDFAEQVEEDLEDKLDEIEFIGRFVAACIASGFHLNLHLTQSLIKEILNLPLNHPDDLKSFDNQLYNGAVTWVLNNEVDGMELPFSISCKNPWDASRIEEVPLSTEDTVVTDENKEKYVQLVSKFKLEASRRDEVTCFKIGFYRELNEDLISLFTPDEFSLVMNGVQSIDVNDWKANTRYSHWSENDEIIKWFWKTVEKLKEEEKALLLQFSTGSPCVPVGGFKDLEGLSGKTKFTIAKGTGHNRIPTASTCFNRLSLGHYDSEKNLREKVLIALRHGSEGFEFL